MSPPSSPRTTSPSSVLIVIPAHEFESIPSNTPPPRAAPKTCSWERRLREAEVARNATLNSMQVRCREHVQHVMSVVSTLKESRRILNHQRDMQLRSSLADADLRRRELLSKKASDNADTRVQRAKIARENSELKRHGERARGLQERRLAHHRRLRYLSERKERARRFSPQGRLTYTNSPRQRSSSSIASDNSDDDVAREITFTDEAFTSQSSLPASVADRGPHDSENDQATPPSDEEEKEGTCLPNQVSNDRRRAAAIIAGYYLLSKARRGLLDAGVIGANIASYSFARVTSCLETREAQKAARLALRAIGLCAYGNYSTAAYDTNQPAMESRILLACLLLALHPHSVMENKTGSRYSHETFTVHCARRMLLCLHFATLGAFCNAWKAWRQAFLVWKKSDAKAIVKAMIQDAVATEAMRISVERGFSRSTNVNAVSYALGGSSAASPEEVEHAQQEHSIWKEHIAAKQKKLREAIVRIAGEEGEQRLNAALSAASHTQNEQLVHEILVDLPGLLRRVQTTKNVPEETWERLRAQLSTRPPNSDELSLRLAEITQTLSNMLPDSFTLVEEDETGLIELNVDFAVMVVLKTSEALKKCQAQAYDDALEQWTNAAVRRIRTASEDFVSVVVDILKELTTKVRDVQVDVLSYRIRHSAPIVQQYGEAWERSHFQSHIVAQEFSESLPRTKAFLSETLSDLDQQENTLRDDLRHHSPEALRTVLVNAIIRLIQRPLMYQTWDLPELMHLDLERITTMQNEVQRCAIVAALDNVSSQFLQSRGIQTLPASGMEELLKKTEDVDCTMPQLQDVFLRSVHERLNETGHVMSDTDDDFLRGMVRRITDPEDQMYSLLFNRIKEAILILSIKLCSTRDSMSTSRRISEEWGRHNWKGLNSVRVVIISISYQVSALASHMALVHGERLHTILV